MDGTVIALGGGGFSMSGSGKSVIDDYVLGSTGKNSPRECLVPLLAETTQRISTALSRPSKAA